MFCSRRFLKKPNVADGRDQFSSLAKNFSQQDCPSYAGFCSLAQARYVLVTVRIKTVYQPNID